MSTALFARKFDFADKKSAQLLDEIDIWRRPSDITDGLNNLGELFSGHDINDTTSACMLTTGQQKGRNPFMITSAIDSSTVSNGSSVVVCWEVQSESFELHARQCDRTNARQWFSRGSCYKYCLEC